MQSERNLDRRFVMFSDKRSKKIVFIAHCLLNQNAISDGTAVYPAAFKEVITALLDADVGIETTSDQDKEIEGMGLFMEMLDKRLREEHMQVPMIGLKASEPVKEKIKPLLAGI